MPTRIARKRRKAARERQKQKEARKLSQASRRQRIQAFLAKAWRAVWWVWKALGVAAFLLGTVSLIYFFSWRLSVTPGETLKDSNPFATMFILRNDGQFPVNDVAFSCIANRVVSSSHNQIINTYGHTPAFDIPKLDPNQPTSAPCYVGFGFGDAFVVNADISLVVSYRPSFFPFRRNGKFRFIAVRKDDGKYAWTPMAP